MKIKDEIFELLLKDYDLVRKIASSLKIKEASVQRWAYRKTQKSVGHYSVISIIKEHSGLTDEQIFELEPINV